MSMKRYYLIIIIILLQLFTKLYSQRNTFPYNASQNLIESVSMQMESKYGTPFLFGSYFIMDSVIINSTNTDIPHPYFNEVFEDPDNTLGGLSMFSGNFGDSFSNLTIVGVIKNGEISWDSGPIIYGSVDFFSFCKDINKDGIVDLGIVIEHSDSHPIYYITYLWILSWDGSKGVFINDYDAISGKSKLEPGYFKLYDQEGDGIYEISTMYDNTTTENLPPNYPYVSYGWNGSKYGLWSSVYQLQEGDYYPAIWIKPVINCSVTFNNDDNLFKFDYTIKNDRGSVQRINDIYFLNLSVQNVIVRDDSEANELTKFYESIVPNSWAFSSAENSYYGLIEPCDERTKGYWYQGNGLPGICDVYFQGLVPVEFTRGFSDEEIIESILENSVKKQTLGPMAIPENLNPQVFIDTLITYTTQSYTLGWMENEQTKTKYENYFLDAKDALVNLDTSSARSYLENVLADADVDSSSTLSSEAYALLRYNAEYLLEQLSVSEEE